MHPTLRRMSPPPFVRKTLATACLLTLLQTAQAATYSASNEAELRQAIISANANPGAHFIDIRADIVLTGTLPPILNTVTIRGNSHAIDGQDLYRLLVIGASNDAGGPRILVQVSNLTLQRGLAAGGDGSNGGGGGLGAGGALLVNSRADVTLSNVVVAENSAAGGTGSLGTGGGGGGLGGNGGNGDGGGGGGLAGNGGNDAGGGGGLQGNGGNGAGMNPGGGGGYSGAGADALGSPGNGSQGLYWQSGAGGDGATPGGSLGGGGAAGAGSGAGGGGFNGGDASAGSSGHGGFGGGGGGAIAGNGGNGGFGGGGGGAGPSGNNGGDGGFGGGGGGAITGNGGNGGFGGGGGGSLSGQGGAGGFGGGGGSGTVSGGLGGTAGGDAGTTGSGGGGALGGGIFVAEGGTLSIGGKGEFTNNGVIAGNGAGNGADGLSAGSGIFLQGSGNLMLRVKAGEVLNIDDSISDSVGAGLMPASSYQQWNLVISGGGATLGDPNSYGKIILGGNNAIGGDTYISGANVEINDLHALGGGGVVALDDGGLVLNDGMTLIQNLTLDNGGGRIGVTGGTAMLSNDISGTGSISKIGSGALVLNGSSSHVGDWYVSQGALVLDADSRLGASTLNLDGGTLLFGAAFSDLRTISLTNRGGTIDNNGLNIQLTQGINSWEVGPMGPVSLNFDGTGTTTLTGPTPGGGNTIVTNGRVEGAIASGVLSVNTGATYALNGANRQIAALNGAGTVELGSNRLTITMGTEDPVPDTNFTGRITGTGGLTINRSGLPPTFNPITDIEDYRTQTLAAGNTYSGGTTVGTGAILMISDDTSIGSGNLTLAGGVLATRQSSSNINITLSGGGGIFGDLLFNGVIGGSGNLVKYGPGTLTLNNANTYVGNTMVLGTDSYLALAHPDALGLGNLQLTQGGGLKVLTDTTNLRPIQILDGVGAVDVSTFDVQSTGGITGLAADSSLRKEGTGRLLLTGDLNLPAGVDIRAGILQVGNGGTNGSVTGNIGIGNSAQLIINRDGNLTLAGNISGNGSMLVSGPGTVTLAPVDANTFLGGLTVTHGTVAASSERGLGFGTVTLNDNGGLLLLGNIDRDVAIGAGGARLSVGNADSFIFDGDLLGTGNLTKTGSGTLVYTGEDAQLGHTTIAAGTLQVGSGLKGGLVSDIDVNAGTTLIFGRDNQTLYPAVIQGNGTVIKRGTGELVLTGEQLFNGVFQVEVGSLRIGNGGTSGSLNGDVSLLAGTRLVFDRSDDAIFNGGTTGAGLVQKSGPGELVVTGNLTHSGGTRINSGILTIGDGGTTGNISNGVMTAVGTQLAFNRSDNIDVDANVSGDGSIVQRGSGVVTLTGTNTQTGGVLIENGAIAVDSDDRLGGGELTLDGGLLRYEAAFGDLRDLRLRAGGGGLDTNGFNVDYSGLISGNGPFTKAGNGKLTFTGAIASTLINVQGGELQLGNNSPGGTLSGSINIAGGATLSLDVTSTVLFNGSLTGTGTFRNLNAAELQMTGNNSAFDGMTVIEQGSLRLGGTLGGDLELFSATGLHGNGTIGGNLNVNSGALLSPGNSIGTINVGGNLTLNSSSITEIEINGTGAASQSDVINVTGSATLDGVLRVLNLPGDYSSNSRTFTVITAGSINGQFASVDDSNLPFLTASVSYSATTADLLVSRNSTSFVTVSLTENQQSVSTAIDAIEAIDPANALVTALTPLTITQARTAYDELHGDSLLAAGRSASRTGQHFTHALAQRASRLGLASRGEGQSENRGPTAAVEGIWLETMQVTGEGQADDKVGSTAFTHDGEVLTVGLDGYWSDDAVVGFALGQTSGDISYSDRNASGTQTGWMAGTYARFETRGGMHIRMALGLGQTDTDMRRDIRLVSETARSTVTATTADALLQAGFGMHVGNFGLSPFVMAGVQWLQRDSINETGAALAGLQVAAEDNLIGEVGLGLELSRPWLTSGNRWAQIQGSFTLLQPMGDTQLQQHASLGATTPVFTVAETPDDSPALALSMGGEIYLSRGLALWGGYETRLSNASNSHGLQLSMRYRW